VIFHREGPLDELRWAVAKMVDPGVTSWSDVDAVLRVDDVPLRVDEDPFAAWDGQRAEDL
jgi:hypothetical protein